MAGVDLSLHHNAASKRPGSLRTKIEKMKAMWVRWHCRLTAKKDHSADFKAMLYNAYDMSILMNAGAAFSTWILLGGFLSLPAALPKIQRSSAVHSLVGDGIVLHTIQSVSVFSLGTIMLVIGAFGIWVMWWIQKENFIWVKDRLF